MMVRKIWFMIAVMPLSLVAGFFPATVHSSIASVNGNEATLTKAFPVNGMSGVVMHSLGKGREAISAIAVQTAQGKIKITKGDLLEEASLPTPKSIASAGDKVIGGYLYGNVLVIAPNAETYSKIVRGTSKNWIHPDLFATFLAREGDSVPTPDNLADFAKEAQVGLVTVVKRGKAILYDPISRRVVAEKSFQAIGGKNRYPFYMRFTKLEGGLFSGSSEGDYYRAVEAIR